MEIRELLVNGEEINVRADEVTNANVGMEKVEYLAGIIEKVADVSPLFEKANKINTTSNSAITVQGTKLPKFVKTAELQEYTKKAMTYEEKVLKADKPVLVDFYSDTCIPCKQMAGILGDIEDEHEDTVYIYKVNVNYDKALAEQYKVMSVPTVICFVNGEQKGKVVGLKEQEEVEALFEEYL